MTSLESAARKNAQSMAISEVNYNAANDDFQKYKAYIEKRMLNLETVTSGFHATVENKFSRMEPMLSELEGRTNIIGQKIQTI